MSLGFVMLVHTAFGRAQQVVHHMVMRECPVVIHVDKKVKTAAFEKFKDALSEYPNVRFCKRVKVEWGCWSMVAATQLACEDMLEAFPEVGHVYLASGSCLPLRPVEELRAHLAKHPDVDFIESVRAQDVDWATDGLGLERFTLRFPFSWKKQRKLFDRYVNFQRRIKFKRKFPKGIVPHLGSQWWCLTNKSLTQILNDPDRGTIDRWFHRVWIPDEAYFQTLIRRWSDNIESHSLTLSKFDHQGLPHVFYDDHLQLLRRSDCYMARKIWPQADRLYKTFLVPPGRAARMSDPNPTRINRVFNKALEQRVKGRQGLYMQSRFPVGRSHKWRTAQPYNVFCGLTDVFQNFEGWLEKNVGGRVHGHLYAPEGAEFAGGMKIFTGCLSTSSNLRNYRTKQFLTNLIWSNRGEMQSFQLGLEDTKVPLDLMLHDANARLTMITGAWLIPLSFEHAAFENIREKAVRLQNTETWILRKLKASDVTAQVWIWTLSDFIHEPKERLQEIFDVISPSPSRILTDIPTFRDLQDFGRFVQKLRNQGVKPLHIGDYTQAPMYQAG